MKLATYRHEGKTSVGVVLDGRILDQSASQTDLISVGESVLQSAAFSEGWRHDAQRDRGSALHPERRPVEFAPSKPELNRARRYI
jgi:hypothetical protein